MSKDLPFDTDAAGLAAWIGRKIQHHEPMLTRPGKKVNARNPDTVQYADAKPGERTYNTTVVHDENDRSKLLYVLRDGRKFEFSVRELEADEGKYS